MKKLLLFLLLLLIIAGVAWISPRSSFNPHLIYTITAGECNYFLLDQENKKQYYISGQTSAKVEQYLDKSVRVTGKVVQTTNTPDGTSRIYYNSEKIQNGECKVNPGIDIAAIKIDSVTLAVELP